MTDEKDTVSEPKKAPRKKRSTKKSEPKKVEAKVEETEVEETTAPAPVKKVAAAPKKKAKRYSFDKWAARRGVKKHHKAGLMAFVKNVNKLRTLEEWDECFKGY